MQIKESDLKRIIKEEVLKCGALQELSLDTMAAAADKAAAQGGVYWDPEEMDPQRLTVSELMAFLNGVGPKGKKCSAALEKIMQFAVRTSERNTNLQSAAVDRNGAAKAGMLQKLIGMEYPGFDFCRKHGWEWGSPELNKYKETLWSKFDAAAGDQESPTGYISPEEAQEKFGLSDDEKFAYKEFVD